jgi:hypothetical protein
VLGGVQWCGGVVVQWLGVLRSDVVVVEVCCAMVLWCVVWWCGGVLCGGAVELWWFGVLSGCVGVCCSAACRCCGSSMQYAGYVIWCRSVVLRQWHS